MSSGSRAAKLAEHRAERLGLFTVDLGQEAHPQYRECPLDARGAAGGLFHLVAIVVPPVLVGVREVAVLLEQSGCAVDQLADNVGVADVPRPGTLAAA